MSNNVNLSEIMNLLKNTFQCTDEKTRTNSEKKLNEYTKNLNELDFFKFINDILDLVKTNGNNTSNNSMNNNNGQNNVGKSECLSAVLFLGKVIEERIKKNICSFEVRNKIIIKYMETLVYPGINEQLAENMCETFILLLDSSNNDKDNNMNNKKKKTKEYIILDLIAYIEPQVNSTPKESILGMIKILTSIVKSKASSRKKIFFNILNSVMRISNVIFEQLMKNYEIAKNNVNNGCNNTNNNNNIIDANNNMNIPNISSATISDILTLNNNLSLIYELFYLVIFKIKKRYSPKEERDINDSAEVLDFCEKSAYSGVKLITEYNITFNNNVNLCNNQQNNGEVPVLISYTNNQEIDININKMHAKVLKFINSSIPYMSSLLTTSERVKAETLVKLAKTVTFDLNWFTNGLVCKRVSTERFEHLIQYMILFIEKIIKNDTMRDIFGNGINKLVSNIILPLLMYCDDEYMDDNDITDEEYTEYINDIEDIIYFNKNKKSIRSNSGKIIKTIYNSAASNRQFLLEYIICLMRNVACGDNSKYFNNEDFFFNILNNNSSSSSQINNLKMKILDMTFLAICIVKNSPKTNKIDCQNVSKNGILLIKETFEKIKNDLIGKNSQIPLLVKHKVILFIRNFALLFYNPKHDSFRQILTFLFGCLFSDKESIIFSATTDLLNEYFTMASKAKSKKRKTSGNDSNINNNGIFNTKQNNAKSPIKSDETFCFELKEELLMATGGCSEKLYEKIKSSRSTKFFDFVLQLICNIDVISDENDIPEKVFALCAGRALSEATGSVRLKFIVQKASENSKGRDKNSEKKIIINKCFNTLRALSAKENFLKKKASVVESSLIGLVNIAREFIKKVEFDEDLVSIGNSLLRTTSRVNDFSISVLDLVSAYIKKSKGMWQDSFSFLNALIGYGADNLSASTDVAMPMLKDIVVHSFDGKTFDKSPYYLCVILQIWFIFSGKVPQSFAYFVLESAVSHVCPIFDALNSGVDISQKKYEFLAEITLIFIGFIHYRQAVYVALEKHNSKQNLKKWIDALISINCSAFEYEIKMLVIAISEIISGTIDNNDVFVFIEMGISLLNVQNSNGNCIIRKENRVNFQNIKDENEDNYDNTAKNSNTTSNTKDNNNDNGQDNDESTDSSDSSQEPEYEYSEESEILESVKITLNPKKDEDEYSIFALSLKKVKEKNPEMFNNWINSFDANKQKYISNICSFRRVEIIGGTGKKKKTYRVPRRIVRIKKKMMG